MEKLLMSYQFDAVDLVNRGLSEIRISKDTVDGGNAVLVFTENNETTQQQ